MICFLSAFSCASALSVKAQADGKWLSMPALSAGAYSPSFTDAYSWLANRAALAFVQNVSVGMMIERRFMLAELGNYGFAVSVPKAWGSAGLQCQFMGAGNWSAYSVGLAYAKKLTPGLALGMQFNLGHERAAGYIPNRQISADISLMMRPGDQWAVGIDLLNIVSHSSSFGKSIKSPASYTVGTGFSANSQTMLAAWVRHESGKPVQIAAETRYRFADRFMASIGFTSDTGSFFGGVQLSWSKFRLFVSGSKHPALGYTPGIALQYSIKPQQP